MKNLYTNCLLTISYYGANFHGWQVQPNKRTVQGVLEEAISKIVKENVSVVGSGRTDAKVNALNAKANVCLPTSFLKKHFFSGKFLFEKLMLVINKYLPKDVQILSIKKVKNTFNARFNAKSKTYLYKIYTGKVLSPFDANKMLHYPKKINIAKMQEASAWLLGEHDFTSFCSSHTATNDHVRTIYNIKIHHKKNVLSIEITGNGFLYNMVRIIVGTLLDVGIERLTPENVSSILQAKNRTLAGKTVPGHALYLKCVKY